MGRLYESSTLYEENIDYAGGVVSDRTYNDNTIGYSSPSFAYDGQADHQTYSVTATGSGTGTSTATGVRIAFRTATGTGTGTETATGVHIAPRTATGTGTGT